MKLILALDQSTSATKAVLFDVTGRIVDKASRVHRQIYPSPGRVEHDAEEIWSNTIAVIEEIVARNRRGLSRIAGISITNQRETFVVFDRKTGRPLHNAIVWQCGRGTGVCDELRAAAKEPMVRDKTGLKIDTYFSGPKLKWLLNAKPHIAARVAEGRAVLGTIDTFLIHRLTQGRVFATDCTNASRTLLFDIDRLAWDADLCAMFDVPLHALPEVRESASGFGETDVGGLLPHPVPVAGVMGDSQASLFAQRCFKPGTVKATFGTGTSVLVNTGRHRHPGGDGAVAALAWVHNGNAVYATEGLINFSGATVDWLKNQLKLVDSAEETGPLADSVPDNGGVYLVPAFSGLGAPHWAPDARAALSGMTAFTQKAHVVRAALESVAYQIRDVLDMLTADSGIKLRALHADGGPTANAFLMQFTADITRVQLKVAGVADSSAWGAAMNGLLALGICASLADLEKFPFETVVFRPRMPARTATRLHAGWLTAVAGVVTAMQLKSNRTQSER